MAKRLCSSLLLSVIRNPLPCLGLLYSSSPASVHPPLSPPSVAPPPSSPFLSPSFRPLSLSTALLKIGEIKIRKIPKQRKEIETDVMGLHIMVAAEYDPEIAIYVHETLLTTTDLASLQQMISTHSSSQVRVDRMKVELPRIEDLTH